MAAAGRVSANGAAAGGGAAACATAAGCVSANWVVCRRWYCRLRCCRRRGSRHRNDPPWGCHPPSGSRLRWSCSQWRHPGPQAIDPPGLRPNRRPRSARLHCRWSGSALANMRRKRLILRQRDWRRSNCVSSCRSFRYLLMSRRAKCQSEFTKPGILCTGKELSFIGSTRQSAEGFDGASEIVQFRAARGATRALGALWAELEASSP